MGLPADVGRLTALQRLRRLVLASLEQAPAPAGLVWQEDLLGGAQPAALEVPLPSALPDLASFDYSVPGGMQVRGPWGWQPAAAGQPGAG